MISQSDEQTAACSIRILSSGTLSIPTNSHRCRIWQDNYGNSCSLLQSLNSKHHYLSNRLSVFAGCCLLNGAIWDFTDKLHMTYNVRTSVLMMMMIKAVLRESGKIETPDVAYRKQFLVWFRMIWRIAFLKAITFTNTYVRIKYFRQHFCHPSAL